MIMTLEEYRNMTESERMTFAASHALAAASGRKILVAQPAGEMEPEYTSGIALTAPEDKPVTSRRTKWGPVKSYQSRSGVFTVSISRSARGLELHGAKSVSRRSRLVRDTN